jgi:hypothetical protein
MRLRLIALALLLANNAGAQTPLIADQNCSPTVFAAGAPLILEDVEKMDPSLRLNVVVERGAAGAMAAADVLEQMRRGKRVWPLRADPAPSCDPDYSEVVAEKRISDERLRQMERRGDVIPLQHQYEQEMYYEDRRKQVYEKACGKPSRNPSTCKTDMKQKACEVLGVVCKPAKHW